VRVARYDYSVAKVRLSDKPAAPGFAPAHRTEEGYLRVTAFTARDGLLEYSDGTTTWLEYRPRAELEAAVASFANAPVTNDHPDDMVSAETWTHVAKGMHIGTPTIVDVDGVAYLQDELLITDSELIADIESGKHELSIGFTSEVIPVDGAAEDGTRCDAVQTVILGNHTASVNRGRAGPACRVFLDSTAWTVQNMDVADPKNEKVQKEDQVGVPVETVEYQLPDGSVAPLPTAVVAMLEELMMLKAQSEETDSKESEASEAPKPEQVEDQFGAGEEEEEEDKADTEEEEEEDKKDTRSDSIEVDPQVARDVIAKRMPWKRLDGADNKTLSVLFATALEMPEAPKAEVRQDENPLQVPVSMAPPADETELKTLSFLRAQGYKV